MMSAAAAVNVDDNVVVPSNGDSAAVSFLPAPISAMAASLSSPSEASRLACSSSGDSTARQAAVAALSSNDTQRPTVEVMSVAASSTAEEEERELLIILYHIIYLLLPIDTVFNICTKHISVKCTLCPGKTGPTVLWT